MSASLPAQTVSAPEQDGSFGSTRKSILDRMQWLREMEKAYFADQKQKPDIAANHGEGDRNDSQTAPYRREPVPSESLREQEPSQAAAHRDTGSAMESEQSYPDLEAAIPSRMAPTEAQNSLGAWLREGITQLPDRAALSKSRATSEGVKELQKFSDDHLSQPRTERQISVCPCGEGVEVLIRDPAMGTVQASAVLSRMQELLAGLNVRLSRLRVNGEVLWNHHGMSESDKQPVDPDMALNKTY